MKLKFRLYSFSKLNISMHPTLFIALNKMNLNHNFSVVLFQEKWGQNLPEKQFNIMKPIFTNIHIIVHNPLIMVYRGTLL